MITMILFVIRAVASIVQAIASRILCACVWCTILFAVLHKSGIVQRIIHYLTEREMTKLANGAPITLASIQVDVIKGYVCMKDVVIHTPQRNEWEWDSPLIARIGRLDAHYNTLSIVDFEFLRSFLGFPCKEIYTVQLTDVQVFVEKRRNVFNFHLLDESLEIPNPNDVLASMKKQGLNSTHETDSGDELEKGGVRVGGGGGVIVRKSFSAVRNTRTIETNVNMEIPSTNSLPSDMPPSLDGVSKSLSGDGSVISKRKLDKSHDRLESSIRAETKANEIVTKMIGAVSSLSRAANEGGKEGLQDALKSQKEGILSQLKMLQTNKSSVNVIAEESIRVMKHVGKMVEKNVSDIKEQVDSFSRPPPKKAGWKDTNTDLFRFGRIVVKDMRIFTKDLIMLRNGSSLLSETSVSEGQGRRSMSKELTARNSVEEAKRSKPPNATGWYKPILIKEVAVSAAELCPPMTLKDERGLPAVAQKIDKVLDIMLKRTLAEMAKSNTGRLLRTWMEDRGDKGHTVFRRLQLIVGQGEFSSSSGTEGKYGKMFLALKKSITISNSDMLHVEILQKKSSEGQKEDEYGVDAREKSVKNRVLDRKIQAWQGIAWKQKRERPSVNEKRRLLP